VNVQIHEVAFRGYKAFPGGDDDELQKLSLAPLTLVFGKNNSGKSVVARLPRLLLGGLACTDERILPLKVRDISYGGKFVDLIHGGDFFGRPTLAVKAKLGDELLDVSATLFTSGALAVAADEPPRIWAYRMFSPEQIEASVEDPPKWRFRGLLPEGARWDRWREAASSLLDRMIHLGPTRAAIQSNYEDEQPEKMGFNGSQAPQWLRADTALAEAVGAWFAEHMEGWRLSLSRGTESFSLRVAKNKSMASNLARAGEGLQQVLPVIVHQILRQQSSNGSFLDVVEQPEIHLHAAAQAPLADLFIDTALTGKGTVLVETHSEPLLLRVQRRVAEGTLPYDQVALYFVDVTDQGSRLLRVQMNPNGEVDWWPEGVFEEDFREVAAIRRAQRRRSGEAG
jgi:AAA ATPase domain/Protein of unknown function (DUF3696)